ncbi:hypothetical protein R1flu_002942 [Riccia fluitans]|uniref:Symplekin n=1 Tax=Riccia fluitans TaxID=41844 RepID=A0ABD1Y7J7_9MARC
MAMVGRMAGERERAYALLGEAKLLNDTAAKTENLKQLLELLLNREPGLIPEFVPHLMDFQADPSSPVLKYLAEIIEEVGLRATDQLPFMVPVLMNLLRDNTPAVARRAISSGTNLFRHTLEQVALQGIYTGQVDIRLQDAWAWMTRFKDAVYPAAYHHGNDGVRLQAIKFVETTVLLFTPDSNGLTRPPSQLEYASGTAKGFNIAWIAGGHPVLDPGAMGQEASKNVGSLLNQLRPFESSTLPGPVAIVLVNSLAAVAKRRPSLYGRVLPVLLGLAPNCENIKGGQVASVVHALKNAFISLLKCQHSGAGPWRDRLVGALRSMNAGDVADSTMRSIDRALRNADRERASRDPRAVKDERVQSTGQASDASRKRPVVQENGSGESDSSNGKRLRMTQQSGAVLNMQPPNMENIPMETVPPPNAAIPMDTGLTPIQQMISMIGALVAQGERAAASVELLITNIASDMLADIVIANMIHLPSSPPPVEEASSGGDRAVGGLVSLLPPPPLPPVAMAPVLGPPQAPSPASTPIYGTPPGVAALPVVSPPVVAPPAVPPGASPAVEALNVQISGEARRDPRRQDPRRLDPRRPSPSGIAKEEDTSMTGSPLPETEPMSQPVEVKSEPPTLAAVPSSQTPPAPPLLAQVKPEPVDEKPYAGDFKSVSPPAAAGSVPPVLPVETVKVEPATASSNAVSPPPSVSTSAPMKDGRVGALPLSGIGGGMGSAGIPVNVPVPTLPVVPLSDEQQVALGKAALIRILEGHKMISAAGGDGLRIALLARLVAQSCEDEQALEVVCKHILADYQNHQGHELALHILYQLYAEQGSEEETSSSVQSPILLAYEKLLLTLAQGLRDTLPPSDKALSRLLAEVPVLPMGALELLQGLCNPSSAAKDGKEPAAGDRITQGLSALWSLILQRPPARETCLKMALQCAVHEIDDIRAKAIRLVANKLYPLNYVADGIESFALEMLHSVLEARQAPVDGAGKDRMDVDEGEPTPVPIKKEGEDHEDQSSNGDQRVAQGSEDASVGDAGGKSVPRNTNGTASMTEAQRCMSLFFALCTKKHALLRELFLIYGRVSKTVKQAVHRHIPVLFRTIGSSSPELLEIISDPPAGSEHLLLQVLHSLTEGGTPSPELISTVKKLYETKLQDAVFLIPVLSSLTKDEVLPIFPRLVDLPPEKFQTALARILQGSAHTGPALTPTEVLIALHGIDPSRDSVPLKKVMDACSACLQQRTVFTQQVLAKVLNQLVEQTPLPLLFMRTVIQAVGAFPTLVSFVMEILSRLVNKQIWKFPKLWIGFLKCANQTKPHSFHVLLQLPLVQLEDALTKHPNLKGPLAAHASQLNVRSTVPRSSLVLLGLAAPDESTTTPAAQTLPETSAVEMQVKH